MKETIEIKKEDLEKLLMNYSSLTNSFLSEEERRGISMASQELFKVLEKNNLRVEFEYDRYYHETACKIIDNIKHD